MIKVGKQKCYLKLDIIIGTKEERDGISLEAGFVDGTVNGRFEDIICASRECCV